MFAILSQLDISSTSGGEGDSSDVSDIDDYAPAHICRTGCPIIKVDSGRLETLVESGKSMCVAFNRENPTNPLRIVELDLSRRDVEYVAISHVRAEGMGNSKGTELPWCRLQEIQGFADALTGNRPGQTFFWIDSLCMPTDRRTKKLAAHQIRHVFASASSVLALVPSIASKNASGASREQLLASISASSWSRRLWTFQEAAVARRFLFQFKDKAVAVEDILPPQASRPRKDNPDHRLEEMIVQFSEDIKVDNFPSPLWYEKDGQQQKIRRHQAKARLRSYLRLSFLTLPMFRYFATERERIEVSAIKSALRRVYAVQDLGSGREQKLRRLKMVLGLLDRTAPDWRMSEQPCVEYVS